jgi:hypothetical protein
MNASMERRHVEEIMLLVMDGIERSGNERLDLEGAKVILVRCYVLARRLHMESRAQPEGPAGHDDDTVIGP